MAKGKILKVKKADLRIVAFQIVNRPDEGRDIRGALKLRALERKINEYLGEYGELVKEQVDNINDLNETTLPTDSSYHERAIRYQAEIKRLDNADGQQIATNGRVEGLLLDHDEYTLFKDRFYGMKNVPASGKVGDAFAAMHEAFENVEEVKLEPVKEEAVG